MKKLTFISLTAALLLFYSCDWNKNKGSDTTAENAQEEAPVLPVEQLVFHDSMAVVNTWCTEDILVEYPLDTCQGALADSVRAWLVETLSNTNCIQWGDEVSKKKPRIYDGDMRDGRSCVDFYGCYGIQTLSETLRPMAEEGMDMPYENDIQLGIEDSVHGLTYTTYSGYHYIYLGGAHGSTMGISQTFRNSDGRRMGWNMLDLSKKAQIAKLIRKGLADYFGEVDGTKVNEENLNDFLMLWDDPDTPQNELEYGIPMPATEPYMYQGAMHFTYQQYEIAAYAVGMPDAVIAIEDIKDCLSAEGRALLLNE